ncbi:hypothetical protein M0R45_009333 [Rubus argutus]|uniref:Uncharacterized protein n=1 Tax=Rubus argutus TaxID=59490 RepID=A0AAW1Y3Q6_RUBAR
MGGWLRFYLLLKRYYDDERFGMPVLMQAGRKWRFGLWVRRYGGVEWFNLNVHEPVFLVQFGRQLNLQVRRDGCVERFHQAER